MMECVNTTTAVVAALESAPALIVPLVRDVPAGILKRRPRPDKWCAHEHACHLAAVQPMFSSRLDLMLSDPNPRITPYSPDVDDEDGSLLEVDLDEAMNRFVRERAELVKRVKWLSDVEWTRTALHPEYSHYSIFIMFRHVALHDMLHAYRIEELLLKNDWPQDSAS